MEKCATVLLPLPLCLSNADDDGFDYVDKKKESSCLLHLVVPMTFFNDAIRVVLKFVSSDTLHCWI